MPRVPTTKEEIEEYCKEYIEREFGAGLISKKKQHVQYNPWGTEIPRGLLREPSPLVVPLNVVPIPKSFMLAGKVFHVEYSETLSPQENANGDHWFDLSRIRLQSSTPGFPMKQDHIEQTFWHEAIHGVLHSAGKHDLAKDEELVMQIAHGVHQILKTARYE